MSMIKTNSLKAWVLAARPKTLSAAAVPVLLGIALAYKEAGTARWIPAVLCLLFAWVMQVDSNLVNDYFDFRHGNDDETRLGPKRACAEGWVTLPAMKGAITLTTLLGCAIGLPLVLFGGWQMVFVGICCVLFCFLYTTTLSYLGLGDVLVLLFFGIVPVCCTYYLVVPEVCQGVTAGVVALSIACGLAVDTLLIVNNYRDHDNDKRAGKNTLVVHIGRHNAERLYCGLGIAAMAIVGTYIVVETLRGNGNSAFLPFVCVYLSLHVLTYKKMKNIARGRELNDVLGMTARNILVFGLTSVVMIIGSVLF